MVNNERTVKIYDKDKKFISSGRLLSLNSGTIKVKGVNLPILDSKTEIIIEILNEFSGIEPYLCEVSVASDYQLNASIKRKGQIVERRHSLKVRTDLSFYIDSIYRNDEDVTKNFPNMKINILNLSIGGMLISSNYDLNINDIITFDFQYEKHKIVSLKAKVIRIDKIYDSITKQLSTLNYGCVFAKLPSNNEAIISKYLYERQLQLYRNR